MLTEAEVPDGIQIAVAGQRFILSGDDAYHLANRLVDTLEGECPPSDALQTEER